VRVAALVHVAPFGETPASRPPPRCSDKIKEASMATKPIDQQKMAQFVHRVLGDTCDAREAERLTLPR
jgi:hypothetical protein